MRRIYFVAAAAAASLFALSAVPMASACSYGCGLNTAHIEPYADLSLQFAVTVIVDVRCTGGTGAVHVDLMQSPTQSNSGSSAAGPGDSSVICDGICRRVAMTVLGGVWNLGFADAIVSLFDAGHIAIGSDVATIQITD